MKKLLIVGVIIVIVIVGGMIVFVATQNSASQNSANEYLPGQGPFAPRQQNTNQITTPQASPPATGPQPTVQAPSMKEFTITGKNYSFAPSTLAVKKGDTVKIIFKNMDGFHDWRIDEFRVGTQRIRAGQENTITFVADKTGQFEFYCSVDSHRSMGMRGTLTVE